MKLVCPDCGQTIAANDTNVDTGIAKCRACGGVINLFQTLGLPNPNAAPALAPQADLPRPPRMWVEDKGLDGWSVRWRWLSPHHFFLLFFCIFWDGFLVFWYSIALFSPGPMKIVASIFPLLHVSVGVGLTYTVIAGFLNHTTLTLTNTTLAIRHGPVKWYGNRTLPIDTLEQLYCKRGKVQKNNNATYQLWAAVRGQDADCLLTLDAIDDVRYLEQQLEHQLGITPQRVAGEFTGD